METDGIDVSRPTGNINLKGALALVIADNLAAHQLGGFFESFTTLRPCRICMITKAEMKNQIYSEAQLRTQRGYNNQVENLDEDPTMNTQYGIKQESPLHVLQYYHVIEGLPSDIGHDIFEGVAVDVLQNVIRYCVQQDFFSLEHLNNQIETFPYSNMDKDKKPCTFATPLSQFCVKQNAMQMWGLLRHLPLLIGNKVPENDPKWQVLLSFLDAVELICAPRLSVGAVEFMDDLIHIFTDHYVQQFPDASVKPKLHFLTHYPRQTLIFGPLIHLWTLRFEGKHSFFKETARRSKNRKNICQTLARKHQYRHTLNNRVSNILDLETSTPVKTRVKLVASLPGQAQVAIHSILGNNEHIFMADSAKVNGMTYSTGCCVYVEEDPDDALAQFAEIYSTVTDNGITYLLLKRLRTTSYCSHFHAFTVFKSDEFGLVPVSHLKDYHPLGLYSSPADSEENLIVLRHTLNF